MGVVGWGAALRGVLALNDLPGEWPHPFCGPWGCTPESMQSLAALHGFWFVLGAPAVVWGIRGWSNRVLRLAGSLLLVVGLLGLLGVGVYEAVTWLPEVYAGIRRYFFHRWLLSIVMLADVPLIQFTLAGLAFKITVRVGSHRARGDELKVEAAV